MWVAKGSADAQRAAYMDDAAAQAWHQARSLLKEMDIPKHPVVDTTPPVGQLAEVGELPEPEREAEVATASGSSQGPARPPGMPPMMPISKGSCG